MGKDIGKFGMPLRERTRGDDGMGKRKSVS